MITGDSEDEDLPRVIADPHTINAQVQLLSCCMQQADGTGVYAQTASGMLTMCSHVAASSNVTVLHTHLLLCITWCCTLQRALSVCCFVHDQPCTGFMDQCFTTLS